MTATEALFHRIPANGAELNVFDHPGKSPDAPTLLFVHGYRANRHWWGTVAPAFYNDYRVIIPEFSGMGDSGWREFYPSNHGTEDLETVCNTLALKNCIGITHSWGGHQLAEFNCAFPQYLYRQILIDSFFLLGSNMVAPRVPSQTTIKYYATNEEANARFGLRPLNPFLNTGGYRWRKIAYSPQKMASTRATIPPYPTLGFMTPI